MSSTATTGVRVALPVAGLALGVAYLVLSPLAFIILLGVVAVLVLNVLRPVYGFYLVFFFLMLEQVHVFTSVTSFWPMMFFPYQLLLLFTGAGWAIKAVASGHPRRAATPLDGLIVIITVYQLLTILWTPVAFGGVLYCAYLLTNVLLYYIITCILRDEAAFRRLFRLWLVVGVVIAAGVVVNQWIDVANYYYWNDDTGLKVAFSSIKGRYSGFAGADHASGFMSTSIFVAVSSILYEKRLRLKALYLGVCVFIFYGLILAGTRGSILGLAVGLCAYTLLHPYLRPRFIRFAVLGTLGVFTLILIIRPGLLDRILIGLGYTGELPFTGRTFSGHEGITEGEGLSGFDIRFERWQRGFEGMARSPLTFIFGLGAGGFTYFSDGLGGPEVVNIWLSFFYDMGVIGVCLLLAILYLVFVNVRHCVNGGKWTYAKHVLLTMVGMLIAEVGVHGLVDFDLNCIGSKIPWLLLAVSMSAVSVVRGQMGEGILATVEEDNTA